MGLTFRRNVATTAGFFVLRFLVTVIVALVYILAAAGMQYFIVGILGETTFNYIVGGLLSLFLGILVCNVLGSLLFMFVRGWHVAALAYANKIRKANAPAVTVGMKAFTKNLVSFGAVYGVRAITKNLLADFKSSLWDLLQDIPFAQNLQKFSENPIIERMASDVLNYGFDATIYYLIKHPPEDLGEVPSTVIDGLKRYLCCLPSIMFTSLSSYMLFGIFPKVIKWVIIAIVLLTQGFLAGLLLVVLMWPLFYILENTFFNPLTMIMFISCFADKCEEEIDPESETARFVDSILEGTGIGTSADDVEDEDADSSEVVDAEPVPQARDAQPTVEATAPTAQHAAPPPLFEEEFSEVLPDMSDFEMPTSPPPMRDATAGRQSASSVFSGLSDLASMPFSGGVEDSQAPGVSDFESMLAGFGAQAPPEPESQDDGPSDLASILRAFDARDLMGGDSDDDSHGPSIDDILSGGDF